MYSIMPAWLQYQYRWPIFRSSYKSDSKQFIPCMQRCVRSYSAIPCIPCNFCVSVPLVLRRFAALPFISAPHAYRAMGRVFVEFVCVNIVFFPISTNLMQQLCYYRTLFSVQLSVWALTHDGKTRNEKNTDRNRITYNGNTIDIRTQHTSAHTHTQTHNESSCWHNYRLVGCSPLSLPACNERTSAQFNVSNAQLRAAYIMRIPRA